MSFKTYPALLRCLSLFILIAGLISPFFVNAQVVINEGSNRNYSSVADEDGEYEDWVELYNAGTDTVSLFNYGLTDNVSRPTKWVFPNISLAPGEYRIVFCSGKDRKPITGFKDVANTGTFVAAVGWNTHDFATPFEWDGVSNILLNTCSYSNTGYTSNSVFNQTTTSHYSTVFAFQDGGPGICGAEYGTKSFRRPNMRLNDVSIGTGTDQNSNTDYPAPYGNWYWAARHQMLLLASELTDAGLTAGTISSIAFDVASTDTNTVYDYIDISMKLVSVDQVSAVFARDDSNNYLHTSFKISTEGETLHLFSPTQELLSSLHVNVANLDNSVGSSPDASSEIVLFGASTPDATNNASGTFSEYLLEPVLSVPSGILTTPVSVTIMNPNVVPSDIYYSIDGSDPSTSSLKYDGTPIDIFYSAVLKARAFSDTILPSPTAVSSYLLGISHVTPVLSVVTDNANLYGPNGIFDNWQFDWEKAAHVDYFDENKSLIFSQHTGIQIDGGAGGSRYHPQHSFRVELDDAVLGEGKIDYPLIPNRPERTVYDQFFLRNGSNQYLVLPYKDACQVESMAAETNNYYSAWRPITVYINGAYFGLYELREKMNLVYFEELDNANPDSTDILSLSFWNGGVLRAVDGSVDAFYDSYSAFNTLDPADEAFWDQADQYFDMEWYHDYIIAESWMGNVDWPWNNIRIYRSDKTNYRWRFCVNDLELALQPNGWTDAYSDHINYLLTQDPNNPYINVWLKGMQNPRFKNYFINRFADLMNTSYKFERIAAIENSMFSQTAIEMQREYARWGDPNNVSQLMQEFNSRHQEFQFQLSERTPQVRNHIQANFGLNGQVEVALNTFPENAGRIQINTVVPDALPWSGVYFDGNPVTITAIPNAGYEFGYWQPNTLLPEGDTNFMINLNVSINENFTAVFILTQNSDSISVSEINYHPDSTRNDGDWIEFHNYGSNPLDVSGWNFTDNTLSQDFFFPAGTIIAPDGYLVLVEDPLIFEVEHPGVPVHGPTGFGFSNSTETLSLFNTSNTEVIRIPYDDGAPWPEAADGYGRTLELKQDTLDPSLPDSWFVGCMGGSPGEPFQPCTEQVIFSEINYRSNPELDAEDWVEIHNTGSGVIDISGWIFRDSDDEHTYVIPDGTILPSTGFLALYSDEELFTERFPNVTNAVGPFDFGLSGSGEAIRLYDATGRLYLSVMYDDVAPWPPVASGGGYTLEVLDPLGNLADGTNWFAGCLEGSPGGPYIFPCEPSATDDQSSAFRIKVFPNPSSGKFNVTIEGESVDYADISLEILTPVGEMMFSTTFYNQQTPVEIDLSDAPGGVYFARINWDDKTRLEKVVLLGR